MLILHKTVHAYERKEVQKYENKKTILASTLALAMIAGANSAHAEVNDATPQQSTGDRLAEIKQHKQELDAKLQQHKENVDQTLNELNKVKENVDTKVNELHERKQVADEKLTKLNSINKN